MCSCHVDRSTLHWRPSAFALAVRLQNSQVKLHQGMLKINAEIWSYFYREINQRKSIPLNRHLGGSEKSALTKTKNIYALLKARTLLILR